ncbi:flagellar filament capping protein FliD [Gracilibacillus kekensis]|uniref:Flagellar hook-associated protein 2 n=1 Tax=Gracilibacillus kekensis TaxID=1027249 RepID=A0A1M7MZA3_9BACI|nr:flagellar filament capping protein FliD [Gracilibacillus kekensis]SHM96557.1 flagellar hook-associated protein 2 [Gracilibacillus kekensis]
MSAMRVTGMASGMDIESMVKDLMKAERMPLQSMEKEKQVLEWKRDDYRSMNTLLLDFRSALTNMKLTTSYRSRQVSSSNENVLTATASSAASQTSYEMSEVSKLATAAKLKNDGAISGTDKIDPTKSLWNENSKLATGITWSQGAIENESITADSSGNPIQLNASGNIDAEAINVRMNGEGYEVVTGVTQADLSENQVLLDEGNKTLTFATGVLQEGDEVNAEYAHDGFNTDNKVLTEATDSYRVSGRSIDVDSFSLSISDSVDSNGTYTIDVNSKDGNTYDLVDGGNVIGTINTDTGSVSFNNELSEGATISAEYQQNYGSFSLGAHTKDGQTHRDFLIRGNDSLNQVISKVNNSDVGLSMMYDSYTDQLTLNRTETGNFNTNGTGNEIIIDSNDSFISNVLKFDEANDGTNETGGDNAEFTLNGLSTQRTSNNFQIDGVTFNLKQTFTAAEGPVSINVSNDTEAVYENIKKFVDTYNTLIDSINSKVNEEYYRDYDPLTDDQKETLSDTQQEDWTEMAKSGLLKNDSILESGLTNMRRDFYTPVNNADSGAYNQLAELGITTSSNYLNGGKLEINEAKLKEAIEEDPDSVENLFRGDGEEYGEQGIMRRLTDTVNKTMDRINERAGRATYTNEQFTIGRNLEDLEDQIRGFEDRLTQVEDRYWSQFTAMEKAMQQANQQSAYLQQALGGM